MTRWVDFPSPFLEGGPLLPIAELFNQSLNTSTVPQQWKTAIIKPIAKVTYPTLPSHYRPIFITPVLFRVMERHIARTYIHPTILKPPPEFYFNDQFAFIPTGSTTAAIIAIF
jgi:hypothetical protein